MITFGNVGLVLTLLDFLKYVTLLNNCTEVHRQHYAKWICYRLPSCFTQQETVIRNYCHHNSWCRCFILCDHFKPYPGPCLYSNNPLLPIVMCIPPKRSVYASISSWQSPDITTFSWHILWKLSFAEAAARIMILVAHAGMLKYFHRAETCIVTAGQLLLGRWEWGMSVRHWVRAPFPQLPADCLIGNGCWVMGHLVVRRVSSNWIRASATTCYHASPTESGFR